MPVYVENKVGAGSRIAVDALKHSQPDGKTMMVSTFSVMGIFPMISAKPTYQLSDFEPVAHVSNALNRLDGESAMPVVEPGGSFSASIRFRAIKR